MQALQAVANITAVGGLMSIAAASWIVADGSPARTFLFALSGGCTILALSIHAALRLGAPAAALPMMAVAFLLPDLALILAAPIEFLYGGIVVMIYSAVVLPRWAVFALHGLHLALVGSIIFFTEGVGLPPAIEGGHPLAIYFATYFAAAVYAYSLHNQIDDVTSELASHHRRLDDANRDLTAELAHSARELTRHQEALTRARRADAFAAVAGGLAHDINNLMAVIQVNSELLDTHLSRAVCDQPDQIRRIMERIQRTVQRGESLSRRMLGVVLSEPLETEPLSPRELVDDVIDLVRSNLPAHIRVISRTDTGHHQVFGDRTQLEQVLLNLLVNAIHAIGDAPGEIRIESSATESCVRIAVHDTGCGIAPDVIDHVFEPFFTTKPEGKGTGLGLAQVKRVVAEHHGTITVQSERTMGTTMTLSLPLATAAQLESVDAKLQHQAPSSLLAAPVPRILLAEDEDDIAEVIVAALPAAVITRCRNAEQATMVVQQVENAFDMLILDMSLPRGTGVAVFRAARARWPEIPTIITTGTIGGEDFDGLLETPKTVCLRKPFSLRELRASVARMMPRRPPQASEQRIMADERSG